jgi:hypothetical protein
MLVYLGLHMQPKYIFNYLVIEQTLKRLFAGKAGRRDFFNQYINYSRLTGLPAKSKPWLF